MEKYFARYTAKDLEGLMSLWSAKSSELEARRKSATELFANSEKLVLKSLIVHWVIVMGEKAHVRVEADLQVIEVQSLTRLESVGHKTGVAIALNNIGNIHFRQGNYTQALEGQC